MMALLMRENENLLTDLKIAKTFWQRSKGLLGKPELSEQEGLWIHSCNSIHTFFMKFPIDCIFLDKKMQVVAVEKNIKPGKLILPKWRASTVVEVSAGLSEKLNIKVGEQLHVGA
jgi:uncharacterized protein